MRFKLGLAIGFAAGYWVGTQADEERKRQVEETVDKIRGNPRVQRVTETVSRSAGRLTDAVEERLVSGTTDAADTAASTVDPNGGSGPARRSGSASGSSAGSSRPTG